MVEITSRFQPRVYVHFAAINNITFLVNQIVIRCMVESKKNRPAIAMSLIASDIYPRDVMLLYIRD